jgi:tRNA 2-selenouridine synthase
VVYCWHDGQRSAAFAHVLSEIGWETGRLEGGYRAYRRAVLAELARLPQAFDWRVVCGLTGAGKSRLLHALRAEGAQILDLETLAAHRGSLLGDLPGEPQPPQKLFESRLWSELTRLSPERPVYVEAESRRIGSLGLPESLVSAMWGAQCVVLEAPLARRVALLEHEYRHFIEQPDMLVSTLEALTPLHGRATVEKWKASARAGAWDELTASLLVQHYDPAYSRAIMKHYPALAQAVRLELADASDDAFRTLARECLAHG